MRLIPIALCTSALFLAACETAPMAEPEVTSDFNVTGVRLSEMRTANLCEAIGGQGQQPVVTVAHSPEAGVPISIRMYDVTSDGTVFEHNTVRVQSQASGSTQVASGFRPPCNQSGGRRNSSYRFDVSAGGSKVTEVWGGYNSTTGQIE